MKKAIGKWQKELLTTQLYHTKIVAVNEFLTIGGTE